jgi:hypothetical protein
MTPRADGLSVPRMTGGGRVVRGAKESAPDRPIFAKEEGYVDRAAERRTIVKQETKRLREEDSWSPIREESKEETETIALDLEEARKITRTIKQGEKLPVFRSKMAENVYKIIATEDQMPLTNKVESFVPGRMAYLFNEGNSTVRTVIRSFMKLFREPFCPKQRKRD